MLSGAHCIVGSSSDCCIYVLNDIGNDPFCRSNMNSDTCNLYKSDIFNMLSDLNMGSV